MAINIEGPEEFSVCQVPKLDLAISPAGSQYVPDGVKRQAADRTAMGTVEIEGVIVSL